MSPQTSHKSYFRTGVGRESARHHGQWFMPSWVLCVNLSTDQFVSVEAGETSRTDVSVDPYSKVFYCYSPWCATEPCCIAWVCRHSSPHSICCKYLFIRLLVTITTCLHQGGQQHGTGWQTEAIPAGKRGIESTNGQTHGHFQVKLQESVLFFPSVILEHLLLPSGHAPPRHWVQQRERHQFPSEGCSSCFYQGGLDLLPDLELTQHNEAFREGAITDVNRKQPLS